MATFYYGKPVIGTVDGINNIFYTHTNYKKNSLSVHINGILKQKDDADGFYELSENKFKLKETPRPGDLIFATFIAVGG